MNKEQRVALRKITESIQARHVFENKNGMSTPEKRRRTKRCLEVIADTAAGKIAFAKALDLLKQLNAKEVPAYEGYTMF